MRCASLPGTSYQDSGGDYPCETKVPTFDPAFQSESYEWLHARPIYNVAFVVRFAVVILSRLRVACIQGSTMIIGNRTLPPMLGLLETWKSATSISNCARESSPETLNRFLCLRIKNQPRRATEVVALQAIYLTLPWKRSITESHPCIAMCISKVPTNPKGGNRNQADLGSERRR